MIINRSKILGSNLSKFARRIKQYRQKTFLGGNRCLNTQSYDAQNKPIQIMTTVIILLNIYNIQKKTLDTVSCSSPNEAIKKGDKFDDDEEKKDIDDDEMNTCPFCRFFLDSPCREPFRIWHKCVKISEKPTDCMDPFRPLMLCMEENDMKMDGTDSDDEDESESS